MTALLVLGLLGIFVAILLAIVASGLLRPRENPDVARSLAAVGAMQSPSALQVRQLELAVPFSDRVLDPVLRHFVGIGRRFTPDQRMQSIRRRLDLAGNPPGWDSDRVVALKALCGLLGFVLGLGLPPLFGAGVLPSAAIFLLATAAGWYAPSMYLYQRGYDRSERIRRELPDALDLMTISVESGLAFDGALSQVALRAD